MAVLYHGNTSHERDRIGDVAQVGVAVRRSDKGLVVYRVSGLASDLGLRVGQVVVELQGRDVPDSHLGRFSLVSADFWTSDHLEAWMLLPAHTRAERPR